MIMIRGPMVKSETTESGEVDVEGGDELTEDSAQRMEMADEYPASHLDLQQQLLDQPKQHLHQSKQRPTAPLGGCGANANALLSCLVCGDSATGKHYGSVACNGCKGFFRRTIRRGYKYTCRFEGNCLIDKHNRAVCRACRYSRCIRYGMKVDAVQNERDLIGKRTRSFSNVPVSDAPRGMLSEAKPASFPVPPNAGSNSAFSLIGAEGVEVKKEPMENNGKPFFKGRNQLPTPQLSTAEQTREFLLSSFGQKLASPQHEGIAPSDPCSNALSASAPSVVVADPWDSSKSILELLLRSEEKIKSLRETVIKETGKLEYTAKREMNSQLAVGSGRKADINDIFHSLHSQLLLVIEWAKNLRPFAELSTEDQTALLKNFASQHIVLCVAYRSINTSNFLKLINDSCIPRANGSDEADDFYRKDCERVMDTLVAPMRFIQMDDVEFVAMKACILFNPVAKGLSNDSVMRVLETRRRIFSALERYLEAKVPRDPHRIGDLTFFILSPLQSLAKSVSEDVMVTKLSGVARIDQLMEELILEDCGESKSDAPKNSTTEGLNRALSSAPPHISDSPQQNTQPVKKAPSQVLAPYDSSPLSAPAGLGSYLNSPMGTNPDAQHKQPANSIASSIANFPKQGGVGNEASMSIASQSPLLSSLANFSPPNQQSTFIQQLQRQHNQIVQQRQQQQQERAMLSTLSSYVLGNSLQGSTLVSPTGLDSQLLSPSSSVLHTSPHGQPQNSLAPSSSFSSPTFQQASPLRNTVGNSLMAATQLTPPCSTAAAANAIHALVVASVASSLAATVGQSAITTAQATSPIDWSALLNIPPQNRQQQVSPSGAAVSLTTNNGISALSRLLHGEAAGRTNAAPHSLPPSSLLEGGGNNNAVLAIAQHENNQSASNGVSFFQSHAPS